MIDSPCAHVVYGLSFLLLSTQSTRTMLEPSGCQTHYTVLHIEPHHPVRITSIESPAHQDQMMLTIPRAIDPTHTPSTHTNTSTQKDQYSLFRGTCVSSISSHQTCLAMRKSPKTTNSRSLSISLCPNFTLIHSEFSARKLSLWS